MSPAANSGPERSSSGGYGKKVGESDVLFLEGQLPTVDGRVESDRSAADQMERCLTNIRAALARHDRTLDDALNITVRLTDLDQYEAVNDVYREAFDYRLPARAVVGVSELLGGLLSSSRRSPRSSETDHRTDSTGDRPDGIGDHRRRSVRGPLRVWDIETSRA